METKPVTTISIFLASSNELKDDRDQFAAFITRLNEHYEPRGFEFILKIWEFLDPAYNNERKQSEYNKVIKQCDYFVALFHTKAGKYTVEELKVAREECTTRQMPLFIYFRDLDYWQALQQKDKNLEEVKQYLGDDLKHFWGSYNNNDKLHLDFVLWLDKKLNQNSTIKVEGDDVKIGNLPLMPLSQLPFAFNNTEYQRLYEQLTELDKDIEELRQDVAEYPDNKKFSERLSQKVLAREKLQQEFQRQQDALLGAAKRFSELSKQQVSEKLAKAIKIFDSGDMRGANALLREIDKESVNIDESFEHDRQHMHQLIDAALVQTSTEMSITETPIEKRIDIVIGIFAKADGRACRSAYPEEKYAKLLFDYAVFLLDYAHYPEAVEVFLRQISLSEKLYGTDHPDTATSYNNIGIVYDNQGDYDQALEYYTKALNIREKVLGENHPDTAQSYNNIGAVYFSKEGAYTHALKYYNRALDIVKKVFGEEDLYTATFYNNVGRVYREQRNFVRALKYYNKALDLSKKELGDDDPFIATLYNNIGAVYYDQEQYERALEYFNKAFEIRKKILGAGHPATATSYNSIGLVYLMQKKYKQALEYCNKALDIREKVLGADHLDTTISYNNIAWAYFRVGAYNQALVYFERAYFIFKQKLGEDNPKTKDVESSILNVKYWLGWK